MRMLLRKDGLIKRLDYCIKTLFITIKWELTEVGKISKRL